MHIHIYMSVKQLIRSSSMLVKQLTFIMCKARRTAKALRSAPPPSLTGVRTGTVLGNHFFFTLVQVLEGP